MHPQHNRPQEGGAPREIWSENRITSKRLTNKNWAKTQVKVKRMSHFPALVCLIFILCALNLCHQSFWMTWWWTRATDTALCPTPWPQLSSWSFTALSEALRNRSRRPVGEVKCETYTCCKVGCWIVIHMLLSFIFKLFNVADNKLVLRCTV